MMKNKKHLFILVVFFLIYSISGYAQSADVMSTLSKNSEQSMFYNAIQKTDLQNTLKAAGPFTIFAPSNAAFQNLKSALLEFMLKPENKDKLVKLLNNHIVVGNYDEAKLLMALSSNKNTITLGTIGGVQITITNENGILYIKDTQGGKATIQKPFVAANNGLIYMIDKVLQ